MWCDDVGSLVEFGAVAPVDVEAWLIVIIGSGIGSNWPFGDDGTWPRAMLRAGFGPSGLLTPTQSEVECVSPPTAVLEPEVIWHPDEVRCFFLSHVSSPEALWRITFILAWLFFLIFEFGCLGCPMPLSDCCFAGQYSVSCGEVPQSIYTASGRFVA